MSDTGHDQERADVDDDFKEIAILCEPCYENGDWGTMWPGRVHTN